MSTVRFSWKGIAVVALCSIVVSTADQLFAQVEILYPSDMPQMPQRPDLAYPSDIMLTLPMLPLPESQGMQPEERFALPQMADSATREIIQNLATQLVDTRRKSEEWRLQNVQLEQKVTELKSLVQQLQDAMRSQSSVSQPQHGAAEEVPAEPISAEPETGIFKKILNWFGF